MKEEEEKCCGNCCWFYAEDTYGFGCCPFQFGEIVECGKSCGVEKEFVSKKEMRHHMAVLLQEKRWQKRTDGWRNGEIFFPPEREDVIKAIDFAYKYMKVFSEL